MTTSSLPRLADELDRLQFGPPGPCLLIEQIPIGFGGQISRRLLGLKLALALGRRAVFLLEDDPPYLQTCEPQNAPVPGVDWAAQPMWDPLGAQQEPCLRFEFEAANARLPEPGGVVSWSQRAAAARHGLPADANLDGEILAWMRPTAEAEAEIAAARARLGVDERTLGVHFRRGDKTVETAYVPARHLNAAIARVHARWKFERLFLASDSPKAVEEIELPAGVRLIFDHEEKRYNNANHKMLFRQPELARQETFTACKNLGLLAACGGIVGQDNAHFATLAAALVRRRHPEPGRVILLSGDVAELEAPLLGRYFALKRRARALARACVPGELREKLLRLRF